MQRILYPVTAVGCLLSIWFGSMIALMLLFDVSENALIIGDPIEILSKIDDDARIIRINENSLVLNSTRPEFTKTLYQAGAFIVLPSLNAGCLALSQKWFSSKS